MPTAAPAGARPPIVLIHGMWCTEAATDRLAELFTAAGYHCHQLRMPLREPGRKDAPDGLGSASLASYFDAAQAQIEALKLDAPPVLVGHSLGGLIAQHIATRMPLRALVLLTPAAPSNVLSLTLRGIRALGHKLLKPGFWRTPQVLTADETRRYAANGMPAEKQAEFAEKAVPDSGRALFELAMAPLDSNKTAKLDPAKVTCPVWVLASEDDWLTPASVVRKVAALYPQAVLTVDPGRSHWVIDDARTPATVDAVTAWIESAPSEQVAA